VRRRSNADRLPKRFDEVLAAVMEYAALALLAGLLAALAATSLREGGACRARGGSVGLDAALRCVGSVRVLPESATAYRTSGRAWIRVIWRCWHNGGAYSPSSGSDRGPGRAAHRPAGV